MSAAERPSAAEDVPPAAVPAAVCEQLSLSDGTPMLVRSVEPHDADALAAGYQQLSATSAYRRFFTTYPQLSPEQVRCFTAVDHHDHEALGAVTTDDAGAHADEGMGVARYIRDATDPGCAELAIAVVDAWQRRGVGYQLMRVLCRRAREEDITTLRAEVLTDNPGLVALLRCFGPVETETSGPTTLATLQLIPAARDST